MCSGIDDFYDDLDLSVEEKDYKREDKYLVFQVKLGMVLPDNGLVYNKTRRYYIEDLTARDYNLENTTPYQLLIYDTVIEESSWGDLLRKVVALSINKQPKIVNDLYGFKCEWSKQLMFSNEMKTNYKSVVDNVYINTNHTALHSCWLLQDFLKYMGIDFSDICFLIHRTPSSEPKIIIERIEEEMKVLFRSYMVNDLRKSENLSNSVIYNISNVLNSLLKGVSKCYTNFYLFDNYSTLVNYTKIICIKIDNERFSENEKKTLKYCLKVFTSFYKNIINKRSNNE